MGDAPKKFHVPLPDKFWPNVGEKPALKWDTWIEGLDDFFDLTNSCQTAGNQLTNAEKNKFFMQFLGTEGKRTFSNHPTASQKATATYIDFVAAAKTIFGRPTNTIQAHYDFIRRKQQPQESIQEYLLALRSLMADCDFTAHAGISVEDFHLAIQLVSGCANQEIRHKLLSQQTINLTEFTTLAEAMEYSVKISDHITGGEMHVAPVQRQVPTKNSRYSRFSHQNSNSGQHSQSGARSYSSIDCSGCGRAGHKYKDKKCPAYGKDCNFCKAPHHFAKFCRKKQRDGENKTTKTVQIKTDCMVKSTRSSQFRCSVGIQSRDGSFHMVTADADTCADMTGINKSLYHQKFQQFPLQKYRGRMTNFDGSQVSGVEGTFKTVVRFGDRQAEIEIYVLSDQCSPVIGRDTIRALGLVLNGSDCSVKVITGSDEPADHKDESKNAAKKPVDSNTPLAQYPNLTAPGIGLIPDIKHKIVLTPEAVPVVRKLRPIPLYRQVKAFEMIDQMESDGIWSKVERSSWVHALVTVDKPNNGVRITTDLSPLNKYVVPFRYPLPNIQEIYLKLSNAKFKSKLDLERGYYNMELDEESRLLTTTMTPKGMYAYNRLPMGLCDSAAVFQHMVSQTLADCPGCEPYIDDIIVYGQTRAEHDINLECVFRTLNEKNLRINAKKCIFAVSEIPFLGHIIGYKTIRPDPKNVMPISQAEEPKSVKDVQGFLGMLNYHHEFLPDLTQLSEPLRKLTRGKNVKFVWTPECQKSFDTLKKLVASELKLAIFDPQCHTIVSTDASDVGIGGLLSQIQNGNEVPIAYGHHTLDERQRGYSTPEKEGLGAMFFCEHWEKFLLGRRFTLRTDHQSLTTLLSQYGNGRKSGKFARWYERLSVFDYKVQYRKGSENTVPDYLSRLKSKAKELGVSDPQVDRMVKVVKENGLSLKKFQDAANKDKLYSQLRTVINKGWPSKNKLPPALVPYYQSRNELTVEDNLIIRDDCRILVPTSLQRQLLTMSHSGHPGIVRMKRKLRECYWWPGMDKQTEEFVLHCQPCQDSSKSTPKLHIPTEFIPRPDKPWEKVAIDITGPFANAPNNMKFITVVVDYYSNFPEILCSTDITSSKIIKWLSELFARYGNPVKLVSDNGPQFVSQEFSSFLDSRDIAHDRSPVYHPQHNGLVEVFNRYLKHGIQTFASSNKLWYDGLLDLLSHYRATALTPEAGTSPAELFFGRTARLSFQISRPHSKTKESGSFVLTNKDSTTTKSCQHSSSPLIQEKREEEVKKPKHSGPYKIGQKVRYKLPQVPKGSSPWSKPVTITEVLGFWTYKLSNGSIWNARKLRRVYAPLEEDELIHTYDDDVVAPAVVPPVEVPRRSQRPNKGVPPRRYSPDP